MKESLSFHQALEQSRIPETVLTNLVRCGQIPFTVEDVHAVQGQIYLSEETVGSLLNKGWSQHQQVAEDTRPSSWPWMNIAQAARLYNLNYRTVYKHMQQGYLKVVTVMLGNYRHRMTTQEWVEEYMRAKHHEIPQGFVAVPEAAKVLGVSPQRVHQLCKSTPSALKWEKFNGYRYIAADSLVAYLQQKGEDRASVRRTCPS